MNPEYTFEALKGNIKIVNIEELIETQKQQLCAWTDPYYTQDRRDWSMIGWGDNYFLHVEPEWPEGQKRSLKSKWQKHRDRIYKLQDIKKNLIELAFPKWQDDPAEFSLDPVVVKRESINP